MFWLEICFQVQAMARCRLITTGAGARRWKQECFCFGASLACFESLSKMQANASKCTECLSSEVRERRWPDTENIWWLCAGECRVSPSIWAGPGTCAAAPQMSALLKTLKITASVHSSSRDQNDWAVQLLTKVCEDFTITEKAPTRASLLKPTMLNRHLYTVIRH